MNKTAVVTGGSSGLGRLIIEKLERSGWNCIDWSREKGVDVTSSVEIESALLGLLNNLQIDLLVNCAGVNRINYLPDVIEDEFDFVITTNVKSIFLCTQALLEKLRGGAVINIVSNASHIPMTSSLAYNASKGAAAIMTKQLARELKKTHDITVFAISPNKLKGTGMSGYIDSRVQELRGWTAEQARAYQLAALPAGEETDPVQISELIAYLVSSKERHKYLNGCDIPYGA